MKARLSGAAAAVSLLLLASCSTPPAVRETFDRTPYAISRDSLFRYRVPVGWFDVSMDSVQSNRTVWIVRDDYAGTIFIREVYLDEAARKGLNRGGLLSIARLTSSLSAASKRGMMVTEPRVYEVKGAEACLYEIDERGEDRVRTVLLKVSGMLYEVSAMASLSIPETGRLQVFASQDAFVGALRWSPAPPK